MGCAKTISSTTEVCASTCKGPFPSVSADHVMVGGALVPVYGADLRYRWSLTLGGAVVWDFGQGGYHDTIDGLGTYGGFLISALRAKLAGLPILYNQETLGIQLTVSDIYSQSKNTTYYI